MRLLRKTVFWGTGLAGFLAIGGLALAVGAGVFSRSQIGIATAEEPSQETSRAEGSSLPVRTIRPKCDPSFALSVKAPAEVVPYEAADLEAQVAGQVEFIRKAEGSLVTAGETLVKIAVPDLDQTVREKDSVVRQRQADLKLAQAQERIAQKAVIVADKMVTVSEAAVEAADGTRIYRSKLYKRLTGLVEDKAATQQIVDEYEHEHRAAVADFRKAQADVLKAKALKEKADAELEAARADVDLKRELIAVARNDRDRAQALADYARLKAPFDGVVTRRNVNRGSFVQNATTAHTEPLLRLERRDLVTITMRVPDTFAPYVNSDTEAEIELSELPGQMIRGKVTRFSPTLESKYQDHTLPVQVDLYNGTEAEYQAFLARERAKEKPFEDLKEGPLPLAPEVRGKDAGVYHRLYPGMYGEMRLVFRHLQNVFLVPSDAIVRQGGTPYLYLVENGKARLEPVEVQVDDQKLAKVVILRKTTKGVAKRDLCGTEEVIYSNQSELTDGEAVKSLPQEWNP